MGHFKLGIFAVTDHGGLAKVVLNLMVVTASYSASVDRQSPMAIGVAPPALFSVPLIVEDVGPDMAARLARWADPILGDELRLIGNGSMITVVDQHGGVIAGDSGSWRPDFEAIRSIWLSQALDLDSCEIRSRRLPLPSDLELVR